MRFRLVASLLFLWIAESCGIAFAQDDEFSRSSLAGLRGVRVLVEPLRADVERAGLATIDIQTDVELRLRHAGIVVLTREQFRREPGFPTLYVNANITTGDSRLWGRAIGVELNQFVSLERDPNITIEATTWSIRSGGGVGRPSEARVEIRESIGLLVDRFINAYLSVNPRK